MEIRGLYNQFHKSLLGYIRSKVRSVEDAQDILQNVFAKIATHSESLSKKEKIQNWLFTITRNTIIDYYRVNATKKSIVLLDERADQISEELLEDSTKGLDQCIHHLIAMLPDDYREIIIDSEINGIAQKTLAEKYSMAYPSMRSRVQRGRERLKQILYNCCHIQTDKHGNILEVRQKDDCNGPCATALSPLKKTVC